MRDYGGICELNGRALPVISTLAAAALALASATSVAAATEPITPGGVTDPVMLATITAIGDDNFSVVDLTTVLDPSGSSTQHYGPYPSMSPDSGTCGNDWADDTFDRHFTVRNHGGSITVVEQFKDGSFMTPSTSLFAGPQSPGACQSGLYNGGLIRAGVTGSMHGYFIIPLAPGQMQTSTDPHCNAVTSSDANCDTMTFINTHFNCTYQVDCSVTTFLFHYSAGDQSLIQHEWKNASSDRGGNNGDIRSS